MLQRLLLTGSLLLVAIAASAQTSNLTATITDPDGQTWNNGTFIAVFIPTPGIPGPYIWAGSGGNPFPVRFNGTMNGSGTFTVALPDNNFISPRGSQWQFTLCGNTSAPCQNVTFPVTGASPNLSGPLSAALVAPRFSPGVNAFGYLDVEVIGPPAPGATYWNVTNVNERTWNGSSWITPGGGPFSSVTSGTSTGTLLVGTGGSLDVTGTGTISGSVAGTLNNNAWYLSQNCRNAPNCTQIHGDLKYVIDATTTSGSSTVTCPNNDCNFVAGDVGKTVWATSQGSGGGFGYLLFTTYACPISTIQTVNNAQSITLAAVNDCTANLPATAALYWGTKDGAALASLDAAAGCAVIHVPANIFILDDQPFLVNAPATGQCGGGTTLQLGITGQLGQPAPSLVGDGASAPQSVFVVSPDFNWTNCKAITGSSQNVCIGGTARAVANVTFWGTGLTSASNSTGCSGAANKNFMATSPVASNDIGIVIAGICPGAANMRGFESDSFDQNFEIGAVISTGVVACATHGGLAMVFRELDCRNDSVAGGIGMVVDAGSQVLDISSFPIMGAQVSGDYQTRGTHFGGPNGACVTVLSGGRWTSYGDYVGTDTNLGCAGLALNINSGGSVLTMNTKYKGNTSPTLTNSGSLISMGVGNQTVNGTLNTVSGASISGVGILVGTCRGTATSSATLGLYAMGTNATPACTSTTVNQGVPITILPLTGSVISLTVNAGTGCKSGNTCVFTVMKNNAANPSTPVATNLTCSMTGGASFCSDTAHFDIGVAGDTYSIQFTTGATETLANVTATLVNW